MRKWRHIWIDLYEINVYFIVCNASYFERKFYTEFDRELAQACENTDGCFVATDKDGQEICIIWITEWSVLAHELFHCVFWILDNRGLQLTEQSEEAYAYLTGYLDKQIRAYKRC